jgi:hypothetical protein
VSFVFSQIVGDLVRVNQFELAQQRTSHVGEVLRLVRRERRRVQLQTFLDQGRGPWLRILNEAHAAELDARTGHVWRNN